MQQQACGQALDVWRCIEGITEDRVSERAQVDPQLLEVIIQRVLKSTGVK